MTNKVFHYIYHAAIPSKNTSTYSFIFRIILLAISLTAKMLGRLPRHVAKETTIVFRWLLERTPTTTE